MGSTMLRGPAVTSARQLVDGSYVRLYRTALLMLGDPDEAEDAVQSALVTVLEKWDTVRSQGDATGYALRTMTRQIWRRAARRRMEIGRLRDIGPAAEATPPGDARVEDRAVLIPALMRLPARMRAVVVLRYFADMTEEQAAVHLGCSVGTIKSQCSRAMARLRVDLGEERA